MIVKISSVAEETGTLLKQYLTNCGDGIVCYGVGTTREPNLNGRCVDLDKIERLIRLNKFKIPTIKWFSAGNETPKDFKFPALARKAYGHGGTDIVPVFQPEEIEWRSEAGWDWFSEYIPIESEYRVWVFRDNHLDTYTKTMARPNEYKYVGRNFRNGFEFKLDKPNPITTEIAINCIKALNIDFGAIDMLKGIDSQYYVLECNTAPGVIRSGAQNTLKKLAAYIQDWSERGCPTW